MVRLSDFLNSRLQTVPAVRVGMLSAPTIKATNLAIGIKMMAGRITMAEAGSGRAKRKPRKVITAKIKAIEILYD